MLVVPSLDKLKDGRAVEIINSTRTELAKSTVQSRAGELLQKMNDPEFNVYSLAYRSGVNVSTFLEALDPSSQHENCVTDAFERIVRASGIRMTSDVSRGLYASKLEDFRNTPATEALIPELLARCYRSGISNPNAERAAATYLSSDYGVGSIMKPWTTRSQVVQPQIINAIPLSALVAITTGINGEDYRGFYIDDEVDARRMKRVTELGELPRTKIKGRTNNIKLYKYGRAIEMSYETLRRMQIDMLSLHLQLMAAQAEADKVAQVIDVLVDGDGNSNAVTSFDLTTLDPDATVNELTLKAWLKFEMKFVNPYVLNVVIAQEGPALLVRLLNTGSANIPLYQGGILGLNNFTLINRTAENVGIGWTDDAPANKLLGIDSSKAVERVYEIGASVSETERFITRQSEIITLSETEGYAIFDPKARRVLNLGA